MPYFILFQFLADYFVLGKHCNSSEIAKHCSQIGLLSEEIRPFKSLSPIFSNDIQAKLVNPIICSFKLLGLQKCPDYQRSAKKPKVLKLMTRFFFSTTF